MKLLGSTKSKIAKDESGKKEARLEMPEVLLVHRNTVTNDYQHSSRDLCICPQ